MKTLSTNLLIINGNERRWGASEKQTQAAKGTWRKGRKR